MRVRELLERKRFEVLNEGEETEREITGVFCCDLLSVAMSRAPAGCAWVTVMGNLNTLAVASLTEAGCVILAEGTAMDAACLAKAGQQGITVLRTEEPVFEAGLWVHERLREEREDGSGGL